MRDYDDKQEKKELLSQWKLEAEFRDCPTFISSDIHHLGHSSPPT